MVNIIPRKHENQIQLPKVNGKSPWHSTISEIKQSIIVYLLLHMIKDPF